MKMLAFVPLAAALAVSAPVASAAPQKLVGTVGPGYTISLTRAGQRVTHLAPGTYTLAVSDRSPIHNFVLEREHGGAFQTTVTTPGFTGTKTVTVKIGKGEWKYYCRPHESTMHGTFEVA